MVVCLEQGAVYDFILSSWCHCHPVTSCFIKIQTGLTFLVLAYPGCPGKVVVKWVSNYGHWDVGGPRVGGLSAGVWYKRTKTRRPCGAVLCRTQRYSRSLPTLRCSWYYNRCRKIRRHFASTSPAVVCLSAVRSYISVSPSLPCDALFASEVYVLTVPRVGLGLWVGKCL